MSEKAEAGFVFVGLSLLVGSLIAAGILLFSVYAEISSNPALQKPLVIIHKD